MLILERQWRTDLQDIAPNSGSTDEHAFRSHLLDHPPGNSLVLHLNADEQSGTSHIDYRRVPLLEVRQLRTEQDAQTL